MTLEDISQTSRDDWHVNGEDGRPTPVLYCYALEIRDELLDDLNGIKYMMEGWGHMSMSLNLDDLARIARTYDRDTFTVVMGLPPHYEDGKWVGSEYDGVYRCRQFNREERLEFERLRGLRKLRIVR